MYGALRIGFDDHEARAAYDAESPRFYGTPHVALLFGISFGCAGRAAPVNRFSVGRAPLAETTRFHA